MELAGIMEYTERQQRELDYHREHAKEHGDIPIAFDVIHRPHERWWNAYWGMFAALRDIDVRGKRVLVVGCGFGDDAIRIAKMGADVYAFDLSPESLAKAKKNAERYGVTVRFSEMPAEKLTYLACTFDVIVARDIMHHVDIAETMAELRSVAKPGAVFVINEIYSHSLTEIIRRSWLVDRFVYRWMQRLIYGPGKPYITEDERKLTERDMDLITKPLTVNSRRYFNFLVTRIIPDRWDFTAKLDCIAMAIVGPLGKLLAGRVLLTGTLRK